MTPSLLFARTDTSIIGRWWWTIDRWLLGALLLLMAIGAVLLMAAGPAAALRINLEPFHFVRRQFFFLPFAVAVMLAISMLSPLQVRRFACIVFVSSLFLLLATPFFGPEIKGATRWIYIAGVSIQPSEFIKPALAVVSAWMFSAERVNEHFPGFRIAIALFAITIALLTVQPDFGQTMVVAVMWCSQFFLAGLSMVWMLALAALGIIGAIGAYAAFPHVQSRVTSFLNPETGNTYQIEKALQAFRDGGIFGRGPGEGTVKRLLPDAHTDFIFAVGGEEFGLLLCLLLAALFAFVVLRSISRVMRENNLFILLAVSGLSVQFGLQALINMASSLHMIPTKGMTLPFVSYGGSSTLGIALGVGMILALTRHHPFDHAGDPQ